MGARPAVLGPRSRDREGGRESLRFGFEGLGLERILSIAWPENLASLHVMEKLGPRPDHDTTHPKSGVKLRIHAITREEWDRSPTE